MTIGTPYFIAPKESAKTGIGVEPAAPTYPWHDLLGEVTAKTTGVGAPTFTTYQGNVKQFQFDEATTDEIFINYHMPHDYVLGTDLFIHYHWSHIATTVTGGTVTWRVEPSYAKGHNQAAFGAPFNLDLSPTASTIQYRHMLSEVQLSTPGGGATQLDTSLLEPDGLILVRITIQANNITVSSGLVPKPFLHFVDLHYQSTNIGTKQKAPNFYV